MTAFTPRSILFLAAASVLLSGAASAGDWVCDSGCGPACPPSINPWHTYRYEYCKEKSAIQEIISRFYVLPTCGGGDRICDSRSAPPMAAEPTAPAAAPPENPIPISTPTPIPPTPAPIEVDDAVPPVPPLPSDATIPARRPAPPRNAIPRGTSSRRTSNGDGEMRPLSFYIGAK